jgi:hypothetical protein
MKLQYNLENSLHATYQFNVRGFKKELIDFLLEFGSYEQCGGGSERVFLTKKNLKKLQYQKSLSKKLLQFIKSNFELITKKCLIICEQIVTGYNITKRRLK